MAIGSFGFPRNLIILEKLLMENTNYVEFQELALLYHSVLT